MSEDDKLFLDRITAYSEVVMKDIDPDPRITPISEQIAYLKPVMEEIAAESGTPLEDVFIRYMDLASDAAVTKQKKFDDEFDGFQDMNFKI